jgi:hypothetical protein
MNRNDSNEDRRQNFRTNTNADSGKNIRLQEIMNLINEEKFNNSQLEAKFENIHQEIAIKSIENEQRILKLKETQQRIRNNVPSAQKHIKELEIIEEAHQKLQNSIQDILKEASNLVAVQENEIIKNFDTKLSAICTELEEKRKRKAIEIIKNKEKEEKYTQEAEILKKSAGYIETKNKTLEEQNRQLKIELSTREAEINVVKKRIESMKSIQNPRLGTESPLNFIRNPLHSQSIQSRSSSSDSRSLRYETIIQKLKQLIDIEKTNLRAAKTAYTNEMEYKTEIEKILRTCVDDVKQEILKKKGQFKKGEIDSEKKIIIDELLNTEDILNKIYDRAYPKSLLKR